MPSEPRFAHTWKVPSPYGRAASVSAMGSVAAPLLAGFSFTLLGLIVDIGDTSLEWPNAAMIAFLLAGVLFVNSVQCALWAQAYWVRPDDILPWWPDRNSPTRRQKIREEQHLFADLHERWAARARRAYSVAILALFTGIAVTLVPPGSLGSIAPGRAAAISIAVLALLIEALWIASVWLQSTRLRVARRWRPIAGAADWITLRPRRMAVPPEPEELREFRL